MPYWLTVAFAWNLPAISAGLLSCGPTLAASTWQTDILKTSHIDISYIRHIPCCCYGGMLTVVQGHHDSAVSYFQKLLDRNPCHYTVLVQLLGMLRRAGKLKEADKYIAAAEAAVTGTAGSQGSPGAGSGPAGSNTAAADGGLSYCKGLLQK